MLNEQPNETKYAVKLNGVIVSSGFLTKQQAIESVSNLPKDDRLIVEVVSVTDDGKEILLG